MLHVHLLEEFDAEAVADLRRRLDPRLRLTTGADLPDAADIDILIAGRPTAAQLAACSNLRALVVPWAGVPDTTQDLLRRYPQVSVHNLHHNAAATAEMAVALMLAAAKFLVPIDQRLRVDDWSPRYAPSRSIGLRGKTALIIGYGQIGRRVGRVCRALEMTVLAIRRHRVPSGQGETEAIPAEVYTPRHLSSLLPRAHVLIITAPLTPETKGLIGERELALLPRGSILVNVGRGAIVDEAALYFALKSGQLAAAGLDVWYIYPTDEASRAHTPPSRYPFHELDNVVMSPHRGGDEAGIDAERMAQLADLLNAAARGESLPNRVDVLAGY